MEKNTLTEGFVPVKKLKKWFDFDEKNYRLISKDGTELKIGQKVRVRLKEIDKDALTLTWELVI